MTRKSTRDKLAEVSDRLTSNPQDRARENVNAVFNNAFGYEIDHPDAPDAAAYESYERYALAAHDWARDELAERVAALEAVARGSEIDDYPRLGHNRPEDKEAREDVDETIEAAAEKLAAVNDAREWLAGIEDSY